MVLILKKRKRKAGTRAGLTKSGIVGAGIKLLGAVGPDAFGIRALAKAMNVSPTAIHAHFKGGYGQLTRAIASAVLTGLAPAFELQQGPKDYLRGIFQGALDLSRQRPELGRFVILRIANDPLTSPIFAERLLAVIAATGSEPDLAWGLRLVISRMGDLILSETSELALLKPETAMARVQARIAALPSIEFSKLTHASQSMASDFLKRADPSYFVTLIDGAVDELFQALMAGKPLAVPT